MGAFDGSTSVAFAEWAGSKYLGAILFEPDDENYEKTLKKTSGLENIKIYNEGASDFCGKVHFDAHGNAGSHVSSEKTDVEVTVSTLDSKLPDIPIPTFIKMDIEGFEASALRGSKDTIKKFAPTLAICIYHKIEDIWEIPLLIKELNPDYKLYMRHYADLQNGIPNIEAFYWELVCYAI
jgi:FkbM family methyltransferase